MNDLTDDWEDQDDPTTPSSKRNVTSFVMGLVMMLFGVAAIVGGIILFFAVKAKVLDLFPFAERLVLLFGVGLGVGLIAMGILLAGWRVAVWFGVVTLVVGIGMLVFGFIKLAEPSLRFYAPLGFFVSLAGGVLIWAGRECEKEFDKMLRSDADLPA